MSQSVLSQQIVVNNVCDGITLKNSQIIYEEHRHLMNNDKKFSASTSDVEINPNFEVDFLQSKGGQTADNKANDSDEKNSQIRQMDDEPQNSQKTKSDQKSNRTSKNPTKNQLKTFLKAYMAMLLSKDFEHIKKIIEFFEGKDQAYSLRYIEHIQGIQTAVKKADYVTFKGMENLLLHEEFGRTTRILFDRFYKKNLDSRILYSRIQRIREHFLFKRVIKKILKDPGGVKSFK